MDFEIPAEISAYLQELDAFIERERQRYAGQMQAYARLLGDPRCALYFPLLRNWARW